MSDITLQDIGRREVRFPTSTVDTTVPEWWKTDAPQIVTFLKKYYENLDYLNYTFLDEMMLLAKQLIKISEENPEYSNAKESFSTADSLIKQGKRKEAIEFAVKAYRLLYFDPPKI